MTESSLESLKRCRALAVFSDFLEQEPDASEDNFRRLRMFHPNLADQLWEIRRKWETAQRSEEIPERGFNHWFPRIIATYQILNPLSQSAEETICLARHLETNQLYALKLLMPGTATQAWQFRRADPHVFETGIFDGVPYMAVDWGSEPLLASYDDLEEIPPVRLATKKNTRWPLGRRLARLGSLFSSLIRNPFSTTALFGVGASILTTYVLETPQGDMATISPKNLPAKSVAGAPSNWQDYLAELLHHPQSAKTKAMYEELKARLGEPPRSIPSPSEAKIETSLR